MSALRLLQRKDSLHSRWGHSRAETAVTNDDKRQNKKNETSKRLIVGEGTFMIWVLEQDGGKPSARPFVDTLLQLLLEMAFRLVRAYCV